MKMRGRRHLAAILAVAVLGTLLAATEALADHRGNDGASVRARSNIGFLSGRTSTPHGAWRNDSHFSRGYSHDRNFGYGYGTARGYGHYRGGYGYGYYAPTWNRSSRGAAWSSRSSCISAGGVTIIIRF